MESNNLARRRFLQQSMLLGTAAAAFPRFLAAQGHGIQTTATPDFKADVELEFSAQNAQLNILKSGLATAVQKFSAKLLKGPQNSLIQLTDNYLGPILNLQKGQKVRVYFTNRLSEPTIIHWHGLHVPQSSDGHPMYSIQPGEQFVYEFEVLNRAGTSFYHSHSHNLTAEQVYRGLAGLIVVNDAEENRLELPRGAYDLPLVIQDRSFNANNQLQYLHGMPQKMMGFLGDTILINGKPNAEFNVKSCAYRFRVLNGSNSRIYKLGWEDGTALTAIGTDAGLLAKPETRPYIMLAPGERVDLWLDFSGRQVGSKLVLYSLPFSGAMPAMHANMMNGGGMGMMMAHSLPQGGKFALASFIVTEKISESLQLPAKLAHLPRLSLQDTDNIGQALPIGISMQHMKPMLNGKTFAMDRVMEFEKVALGSLKLIKIYHEHVNQQQHGGMGMMGSHRNGADSESAGSGMGGMGGMLEMAHPIHLHGQQFQIIGRKTSEVGTGYETVKHGFIDSGWKDTVLVMPGEEVEIIKPFQDYKGLFLYHCHNLEHEDLGMMRQFLVS